MRAAQMKERPDFQLMRQTDIQSIYYMKMPRWLFFDPRYAELSLEAKVAYTFLLNRFQLSRRQGWVNERGEVFVIFPRKALAKELRICEQRVTTAFRQLVEAKLVWEKRCGRGGANQIYLAKVETEDFSDPAGEGTLEPEADVPEPDMEQAPDFWSDSLEVSSADAGMGTAEEAGYESVNSGEASRQELPQPVGTIPYRPEEDAAAPPVEQAPSRPGLMAEGAERRAFFGLDFRGLDRNLSQRERQEWNNIYASFRGHSVMSGKVAGIDPHSFRIRDRRTGEIVTRKFFCAVVIPFRVPILIPETELWFRGEERPRNVTRNIGGATIDFVITQVDREKRFVVASRRLALASRRYFFSTQPQMNRPGSFLECRVLTVGHRLLLATCHGYDITLTQRDLDYTAIPDLKDQYRRDNVLECVVKEYNSRQNHLMISVKETIPNPFDGAKFRHPLGCSRQGLISGKYGGGVFCNLTDGVTVMCNYSFQYTDSDFLIGDSVTVVIQRYNQEKKQIFGKIVAKE